MKKFLPLSLLCFIFFISGYVHAQTPEGIKYQAVARDNGGAIMADSSLNVRMTVFSGSMASNLEYEEIHTGILTNQFGLFSLTIGQGTQTGGPITFDQIDWGSTAHHLEVAIDPDGSGTYQVLDTNRFYSVPYALHAKEAGNTTQGLQETYVNGDTIRLNSGGRLLISDNAGSDSLLYIDEGGGTVGIGTDTITSEGKFHVHADQKGLGIMSVSSGTNADNAGVYGRGMGGTNKNYGLAGEGFSQTTTDTAYGVVGNAHITSSGTGTGLLGVANDYSGNRIMGVQGIAEQKAGVVGGEYVGGGFSANTFGSSGTSYGVFAQGGSNGNKSYGIFADGGTADTNIAGFFTNGNVHVMDTLVLPAGAAPGYMFMSDGISGKGVWRSPSQGVSLQNSYDNGGNDILLDGTNNLLVIDNFSNTALTIQQNGFVGINTATPNAPLEVNGAFRYVDGNQAAGKVLVSDGQGDASWQAPGSKPCPGNPDNPIAVTDEFCIDEFESPSDDWWNAVQSCGNKNGHLCSRAEWHDACSKVFLSNETDDWEWTSNSAGSAGVMLIGNGGCTQTNSTSTGNVFAYRCCYYR